MSPCRTAFLIASLVAVPAFAAETSTATPAPAPPAVSNPSEAAAGRPATSPEPRRRERRIPGRVVIAEVLSIADEGKTLHVKTLKADEVELHVVDTSRMPEIPVKVGEMIRCRFDETDGKNVILFAQLATQMMNKMKQGSAAAAPAEPQSVAPVGSASIAPIR